MNQLRTMNQTLENISAHYKIKEEPRKENVQLLNELLKDMVKYLKNDDLFTALYTEADPAGSYWDGLKVEKPDEYDINFKFYFPRLCDLTVESKSDGNVTVEVDCNRLNQQNLVQYKKFRTLLDEEGYLSWDKVNRWFESIVKIAVDCIQQICIWTSYEIKQQKNGPAKTLRIYKDGEHVFDVDLVPCFFIDSKRDRNLWPNNFTLYEDTYELGYYLIPKPNDNLTHWRPSFQKQEKKIINNKGVVKQVIRLIKVIRNNSREMHFLKSYFIKTVPLWKLKDDPAKFERKTLKDALILVLKKLQDFVSISEIPFFWEPNCNLLQKQKADTFVNTSNRLKAIIKYLEQDDILKIKALFDYDTDSTDGKLHEPEALSLSSSESETNFTGDEEVESRNSYTNPLQTMDSSAAPWIAGIAAVGLVAAGTLAFLSKSSNRKK